MTGNVLVKEGVTLTIEPGVVVNVSDGKYMKVEGFLKAEGNSSNLITIQSSKDSPSINDWLGIQIRPTSTSSINENQEYVSGSRFNYVILKNAERGLYIYNTGIHISNTEFKSNNKAIELRRVDGVVIDNSIFSENYYGIWTE